MDQIVLDLIERRHFKEAQKNLHKRLRKNPNDVDLLITQAKLLLATDEPENCKRLCEDLCARKPQITNYEHLTSLFEIISKLRFIDSSYQVPQIANLWQGAIQIAGTREEQIGLAEDWASQSIKYEQWSMLAKAALTLQRQLLQGSKERRQYWFWQITAYYLSSLDTLKSVSTTKADISTNFDRIMALRLFDKAFEDMPYISDEEQNQQLGSWISKPAELRFLCQAYLALGHEEKLGQVFKDSRVHNMCIDDLEIQRLEKCLYERMVNKDSELLTWATTQLDTSLNNNKWHLVDNWAYWVPLLCRKPLELSTGQIALIERACAECPQTLRAPKLAKFQSRWQHVATASDQAGEDGMDGTSNCELFISYFFENVNKGFAIDDLRRYVIQLSPADMGRIKSEISKTISLLTKSESFSEDAQLKWFANEMGFLEIELIYIHSRLVREEPASYGRYVDLLQSLVCNCLNLYHISLSLTAVVPITAPHPGDQAGMLAVEGLRLLFLTTKSTTYKMQSLCLLSFMLSHAKHNFHARILFIEAALESGLPSIAWDEYKRLDVKKILHEKLSPLMFGYIGLIQPFPTPGWDAHHAMKAPLDFYNQALADIPEYQEIAMRHENYAAATTMTTFVHQLQHSATRTMLLYESRRVARITGKQYDAMDLSIRDNGSHSNIDMASRAMSTGQLVKNTVLMQDYVEWLAGFDAVIELMSLAESEQREMLKRHSAIFRSLERLDSRSLAAVHRSTLETPEKAVLLCCVTILKLVIFMNQDSLEREVWTDLLGFVEGMLETMYSQIMEPAEKEEEEQSRPIQDDRWYRRVYESYELWQACQRLFERMVTYSKRKWPHISPDESANKMLRHIQKNMVERLKAVKEEARRRKSQIDVDKASVRQILLGRTGTVPALTNLVGTNNLDRLLTAFGKSSQVALDGVGQLQLR